MKQLFLFHQEIFQKVVADFLFFCASIQHTVSVEEELDDDVVGERKV